jgi:hypothetical protein
MDDRISAVHLRPFTSKGYKTDKSLPVPTGETGGTSEMTNEQLLLVLVMVACILVGLVFVEVRRLRKFTERK